MHSGCANDTYFSGHLFSNLSVNHATETAVPLVYDEIKNMLFFTPNITIQKAGLYRVDGALAFADQGSPATLPYSRQMRICVNGVIAILATADIPNSLSTAGALTTVHGQNFLRLAVGDVVSLRAYQTSGVPMPIIGGVLANAPYSSLRIECIELK